MSTRAAKVIWFAHPGDSPLDVRARPFIVKWDEHSGLSINPGRSEAASQIRVLYRWEYICRGVCSFVLSDDEGELEGANVRDVMEIAEGEEGQEEHPDRWHKCRTNVKLVVSQ